MNRSIPKMMENLDKLNDAIEVYDVELIEDIFDDLYDSCKEVEEEVKEIEYILGKII